MQSKHYRKTIYNSVVLKMVNTKADPKLYFNRLHFHKFLNIRVQGEFKQYLLQTLPTAAFDLNFNYLNKPYQQFTECIKENPCAFKASSYITYLNIIFSILVSHVPLFDDSTDLRIIESDGFKEFLQHCMDKKTDLGIEHNFYNYVYCGINFQKVYSSLPKDMDVLLKDFKDITGFDYEQFDGFTRAT